MQLEIEVRRTGENAAIKLSGNLDMYTSPDFHKDVAELCRKGQWKTLALDLTNVSYIDTAGLATLVQILLAAKDNQSRLILSGLSERVRYLLDASGLTGFFEIEGSERPDAREKWCA